MFLKLFILFLLATLIQAEQCTTPNNEVAQCVSLYTCPILINALGTQHPSSLEFVRQSNCGGTGSNPLVCCGSSANFTAIVPKVNENSKASNNLLPDRKYCGYQHSDDYFRQNHNKTEINEFPWLALLLYKDNNGKPVPKFRCSASLINNRYVLTAGVCIKETKALNYTLTTIRLGDFNVQNQTDCVNTSGINECSNPVEDFGFEKIIIHPEYANSFTEKENDIALIRLEKKVVYSDYIRPICLPLPGTKLAQVGEKLLMTGWGKRDTGLDYSEIKKKIQGALISNEECASFEGYRGYITKNHICTVHVDNGTDHSCSGDSGGPVIFASKYQWHQEGIISFGASDCRSIHPNVHTKVQNYLEWIQENIEP